MTFVNVKAYHAALVFENGAYKRCLRKGFHFLKWSERAILFDMTKPFNAPIELSILLRNEDLRAMLEVVEVKDNEIALRFDNGLLQQVLVPGRYVFWKGYVDYSFIKADLSKIWITEIEDRTLLARNELAPYVRTFNVEPSEKALMYADGKLERVVEPGVYHFWKNAIAIQLQRIDVRQQQMEMSGQEILTKDKATIRVSFFTRFKVTDMMIALRENKEYDKQLYILMQMAMREYIGSYTLDELLEKRNEIAPMIIEATKEKVAALGIVILECGIRDIILPGDVKDIMNQVLIADKKAQANTITRREDTASTRSLLNTAKLMEENPMLFKLKEMEYVEKIADKISNISVSGSGDIVGQLKQIFVPR